MWPGYEFDIAQRWVLAEEYRSKAEPIPPHPQSRPESLFHRPTREFGVRHTSDRKCESRSTRENNVRHPEVWLAPRGTDLAFFRTAALLWRCAGSRRCSAKSCAGPQ